MIHIADKIYITYAETTVGSGSEDRLPDNYVRIIDKGLTSMIDENTIKNEIAYGKTVDEVFSQFKSESDFFETLLSKIEDEDSLNVNIYADENSMLEFLIRWWKAIFPNLKADGAYALYTIYADSESLRTCKGISFIDITVKSDPITFDKFINDYWSVPKELFFDKFNHFKAFDLPQGIKDTISVEYLVMDYLASGRSYKPALQAKMAHLYKKLFIKEVFYLVKLAQEFFYYIAADDPSLKEASRLDGVSIRKTLEKDTRFRALLDTNIQNDLKSYNHVRSKYEIDLLCKTLLDFDVKINARLGLDPKGSRLDNPTLYYYSDNNKDPNLQELLDKEIEGSSNFRIFVALARRNKFNPYIIPAFRNLVNEDEGNPLINQFRLD